MYPKSKLWVDPFATWHRRNSSTLGFADGRVETHRWLSEGLITWNEQSLYEPLTFQFYRAPNSDEKLDDFELTLKGYAIRALQ